MGENMVIKFSNDFKLGVAHPTLEDGDGSANDLDKSERWADINRLRFCRVIHMGRKTNHTTAGFVL